MPAGAQEALARARRVGYAAIGPGTSGRRRLHEVVQGAGSAHGRRVHGRPVLPASRHRREPVHGQAWLSLAYCRRILSDAERAALEASCRVCIPPDDALAGVSSTSGSVTAIVPLGLAVPLAARLLDIVVRPDSRPGPQQPRCLIFPLPPATRSEEGRSPGPPACAAPTCRIDATTVAMNSRAWPPSPARKPRELFPIKHPTSRIIDDDTQLHA